MAVEVIGRKTFCVTCAKCGSELRYTFSDIKTYKTNKDYLGDYDMVKGVECPVCHTVTEHRNVRSF